MIKKSFTVFLVLVLNAWIVNLHAETGDGFGRLFSRPNERANLDILRQNQKLKTVVAEPVETGIEATPLELPDPITMQGYVKRNDGSKSTLWINNQPVQEDSTVDNVQIGKLHRRERSGAGTEGLDVKIPANGKHIRLKAGQVYEPETNQIKELKAVEKEKQLNLEETGVIGDDARSNHTQTDSKIE